MELLVKAGWGLVLLVHAAPAAALFAPGALRRLYGLEPGGELGVLMTHRAALFLGVVVLSGFALVDPAVRRAASVTVAISVLSFLALYARAGAPRALRKIALADAVALLPLGAVAAAAWVVPG